MSARSALTLVGEVVGAYLTGSPYGAAIGGAIGGELGGAIDGPQRNTQALLSDLTAIKFDYGSSWPRMYGRYRFKISPMWSSTKRPVAHEQTTDSKGGPSAVSTSFTYSMDWLCWVPLGAIGFARIWENGTLGYSGLADSDDATLAASQASTRWTSLTFLDGNPAQLTWPVYEAAVGTANAVAYRYRPMFGIEALDLGGSGQPPLIEVEFYTAGTQDAGGGFVEGFEEGLVDYGSPDPAIFGLENNGADIYLKVIGGVVTSVSTSIVRNISVVDATQISFEFRVDDLTVGTAPEDGPVITVALAGSSVIQFDTAREKFFDSGQRPFVSVAGATSVAASGAPITVGLWYKGVLTQDSSTVSTFTLSELASGTVIQATGFTGTYAPWTVDQLVFNDNGSAGSTDMKPTASFNNVVIGSPVPRVTFAPVSLADIVRSEALLLWTGVDGALTADDIDVTELESIMVTGFATTGSPREAISQLADMYYFGCVCSDKLYFRLRGAASIGTVGFDHTGIGVGQAGTPFTGMERGNDLEVPILVSVTGPDVLSDYDPDTQQSDRLVGESVAVSQYTTPVVFTPSERKGRADTMVLDARVASNTAKVSLDDRHVEKEPFDVWVQTDDQGNTYRVRSNGETYADGVHDHDVVLDDPTVLSSSGITTEIDQRAITVSAPPASLVVPLDIPIGRDADNSRGYYVAVLPATTAGWDGYTYFQSADNVTFTKLGAGTKATVIGTCSVVPGNWTGGRRFDWVDSIVVDVGSSGPLVNVSRAQLYADESVNAFAIGAHGRWLLGQFLNATLLSPGVYSISGLILGSKGTEQYIGTQVVNDRFVLLRTTGGVIRVPQEIIDDGALRYYKGVSTHKTLDTTNTGTITAHEVGLMPLSPVRVFIARDTSGNATIRWQRRTRLATRKSGPSGILIPLGEDSESYSVDVFSDGTYTTVVRTLTSSTASVAYSASQQTTDFGSAQSTLYIKVFQISDQVGRGFEAQKAA